MGRPRQVVLDVPRDVLLGIEGVAQAVEQAGELLGGQQVEEHQHVGLLRSLVAVGGVALRLQNAVETMDIAVLLLVPLPVEFLQGLVPLELADDPLAMEGDQKLPADRLPPVQLVPGEDQLLPKLLAVVLGQQVEQLQGAAQHPGGHHVRVGVVVEPRLLPVGVAVVVLVGPHDPLDLVPVERTVVGGETGEEPGDLHQDLTAPVPKKLEVSGHLVVLPDVVGHRDVDMALAAGVVGDPSARPRVQVEPLALLPPVAAALPGVHGPRVPLLPGGPPSFRESPPTVLDEAASEG